MCKNSHIIDSSYEWYLKVNDLVDELYACHGSRTTRPNLKECMRSGDQEATLLTSFLIG